MRQRNIGYQILKKNSEGAMVKRKLPIEQLSRNLITQLYLKLIYKCNKSQRLAIKSPNI